MGFCIIAEFGESRFAVIDGDLSDVFLEGFDECLALIDGLWYLELNIAQYCLTDVKMIAVSRDDATKDMDFALCQRKLVGPLIASSLTAGFACVLGGLYE
jgi:hypothetical protein